MDAVLRNQKALKEFRYNVKQRLGAEVLNLLLFGSAARGTSTSGSDIDVLVILRDENKSTRDTIIEISVDVNLKYDVLIAPVVMSSERFSQPLFRETAFYKSMKEEGISL